MLSLSPLNFFSLILFLSKSNNLKNSFYATPRQPPFFLNIFLKNISFFTWLTTSKPLPSHPGRIFLKFFSTWPHTKPSIFFLKKNYFKFKKFQSLRHLKSLGEISGSNFGMIVGSSPSLGVRIWPSINKKLFSYRVFPCLKRKNKRHFLENIFYSLTKYQKIFSFHQPRMKK